VGIVGREPFAVAGLEVARLGALAFHVEADAVFLEIEVG
jgi:hypothetical protein